MRRRIVHTAGRRKLLGQAVGERVGACAGLLIIKKLNKEAGFFEGKNWFLEFDRMSEAGT